MSTYEHLNFNEIPRGRDYKPALTIYSVNSKGQSGRFSGNKTGREHHFLSLNEQNYFLIAEFSNSVADIREQFPLNIDKTHLIAKKLGLKHPAYPKAQQPMTTDFCITKRINGITTDIIRTIKPATDLLDRRTIEKFEIERIYWDEEGIDWGIVTDLEINKTMAKNIKTFRGAYDLSGFSELRELGESVLIVYKRELAKLLISENNATRDIIHKFATEYHLRPASGITLFHHLLATKVLRCDLSHEMELNKCNKLSYGHEEMDRLLRAE